MNEISFSPRHLLRGQQWGKGAENLFENQEKSLEIMYPQGMHHWQRGR